jgi:hypothetical protein
MMTATLSLPAAAAATNDPQQSARAAFRRQLLSTAADTAIPLGIYWVARHGFGCTEMQALLLTAVQPLVAGTISLRREQRVSPASVLVFFGVVITLAAMALGGSAQVFLLRESLLTVVLGIACLASLPTRRPLMFFFVRHFSAGAGAAERTAWNAKLTAPGFLHAMRVITAVWGVAFVAEFSLRAWLVFHCTPATVLAVSPLLFNGMLLGGIGWSIAYGKRRHARAAEQAATVAA